MARTTHTPGPWAFMTDSTGEYLAVYARPQGGTKVICPVKITDESDAMLIAAAPDLLAALLAARRLFAEALPRFDWGRSALDANAIQLLNEVPIMVEAAIANAKGER
jgi:hypothetical protein